MKDNDKQKAIVQKHFTHVSGEWGNKYQGKPRKMSDLDLQLRREHALKLFGEILDASEETLKVLDLGCGAGNALEGLPRNGYTVFNTDIAEAMVAQASKLNPQDFFFVSDAKQLPIVSRSVDVVLCLGVLEYIPEPSKALACMCDCLKPGGSLIISFPNRASLFRSLSEVERAMEHSALIVLDKVRGKVRKEPIAPQYAHQQWDLPQAVDLLETAGFRMEETMFSTFGTYGRSGRLKPMLAFSRWMTKKLRTKSGIAKRLGCTMVVKAEKPAISATMPVTAPV